MNPDYDKFLQDRQIDKFISINKFDSEVIHDFITYITSRDINDYFLYKDTLVSLIDTKNFTDIPLVFYSMLKSEHINFEHINFEHISESTSLDDILVDLVGVCSNFSVNIIQKFKGSPLLLDILNLLVDISYILYTKEWMYECTQILYFISLFVTNCSISSPNLFTRYYDLLSKILIDSNNFNSAGNALSYSDKKLLEKYALLCVYKNEGTKFNQFLLKMKMSNFEDSSVSKNVLDGNWLLYIENINKRIPFKDNIKFVSFMSLNSLSFVVDKDEILIGSYKYQSVDSKVHDIIDLYTVKESVKENMKESVKMEKKIEKKADRKKKEVKFTDNFTVRKAKFNIYCEILKNNNKNDINNNSSLLKISYDLRNKDRKRRHEAYYSQVEDNKVLYTAFKDEIEDMISQIYKNKKVTKTTYVRPEIQSSVKSWRDEDDGPTTAAPFRPTLRKREEIHSDRNIYTYGETAGSYRPNVEAFKPNVEAFKPKIDAYKPEAFKPNVEAFKPNVEAFKPNVEAFKPNVEAFKPKLDALKSDAYKPTTVDNQRSKKEDENSQRKQSFGKWYDDKK